MPALTRIICVLILAAMAIFIGYGFLFQSGPGLVAQSMVLFWGKFVWTDLSATFLLFATIIVSFERNWLTGAVMLLMMILLGALAIAAWLLWRGPELYRRLHGVVDTPGGA